MLGPIYTTSKNSCNNSNKGGGNRSNGSNMTRRLIRSSYNTINSFTIGLLSITRLLIAIAIVTVKSQMKILIIRMTLTVIWIGESIMRIKKTNRNTSKKNKIMIL